MNKPITDADTSIGTGTRAPRQNGDAIQYAFAKANGVLLFSDGKTGENILGYKKDTSLESLAEARRAIGGEIPLRLLNALTFETNLAQHYAQTDLSASAEHVLERPEDLSSLADNLPQTADLLDTSDDAPVIRLINGILQEAIRSRASDIHIEPYENRLSVRFRIDGALREMLSLPDRLSSVLVSRVKVMAQLDIAKKRLPQDGRFSLNLGHRAVDVRVSTLPSRYGERVVMRILEKNNAMLTLQDLGMGEQALATFGAALAKPNGIILVSGPTGSGKTTSLYAAIRQLNDGSRNILTVEDPVEYALDGIGQTQVNAKVGMSFAAGLRAMLRQDPDVVMVGEIRDPETAEIAVQAALTGHLVLSTVHTNSAIAAITRLRDMNIEPFLLSSTVNAIVAQRLVRKLCPHCKTPYRPNAKELSNLGLSGRKKYSFYQANGCEKCVDIGYYGRLGLYEIVMMDDVLRAMVHDGAQEHDLAEHAFKNSQTLLQNGVAHLITGHTSVAEVLRVCRSSTTNGQGRSATANTNGAG